MALQFPSALPTGIQKPYFLFGDGTRPVDLWFVDVADPVVQQFIGRGSDSITPNDVDEFELSANFDRGQWTVIVKRAMKAETGVSFEEGQFAPVAFSAWDGFSLETGNKRALSAWFYTYVRPSEAVSATGPMLRAAGGVLILELIVIFLIRRRFAGGAGTDEAGEAVPQGGMASPLH